MAVRTLIVTKSRCPTAAEALAWARATGFAATAAEDVGDSFRLIADAAAAAYAAAAPAVDADTLEMEVFQTGTWNDQTWTTAALDAMVANFGKLRDFIKPPLKLGHDDAQQFIAQANGQPALGWLDALRRDGAKLIARFRAVPQAVRQLIQQERYKRVSAEVYPNWQAHEAERNLKSGVTGPVLSAVALLGADIPVVKSLTDLPRLLAMEGATFSASHVADGAVAIVAREHPPSTEDRMADEAELKKLKDQIAKLSEERDAARAEVATAKTEAEKAKAADQTQKLSETVVAAQQQIKTLQAEIATERKQREDADERLRLAEADRLVAELSAPGVLRILPHQRPAARFLLAHLPSATLTFGEGDKATETSLRAVFEEFLRALPDRKTVLHEVGSGDRGTGSITARLDAAVAETATRLKLDPTNRDQRRRIFAEIARTDPDLATEAANQPAVLDRGRAA